MMPRAPSYSAAEKRESLSEWECVLRGMGDERVKQPADARASESERAKQTEAGTSRVKSPLDGPSLRESSVKPQMPGRKGS